MDDTTIRVQPCERALCSEARNALFQVYVVLTVIGHSLFGSGLFAKLTTTIITYRHKSHVRVVQILLTAYRIALASQQCTASG